MTKGIALATDTIVYIILAVTVLAVLLWFFTSNAGPVETRVDNERLRIDLCGQATRFDPNCDGKADNQADQTALDRILSTGTNNLVKICKNLNIACSGSDCAKKCCMVCP
jgi:hypothetical protein